MSRGDKVTYGGAPPKLDLNCIDNPQILGDAINYLFEVFVDVNGGGYIPDATEAAAEPQSIPTRRLVRFELDGTISSGTASAFAIEPDGSQTPIASPTFTVHDTLGRYEGASSGKTGWAMYTEYPGDTYIFEIISLGGEGTVTGTANDEKFKISSDDTTEGYLKAKAYNNAGSLPGGVSASVAPAAAIPAGYQECFVQAIEDSPAINEQFRIITSSVSATLDYTVKVNSSDTTSQFLDACFHSNNTAVAAYDADDHSIVQIETVVDSPSAGERQLRLFVDRALESGRVKQTGLDVLEYLNAKFHDYSDTNLYDLDIHDLVVVGPESNDDGAAGASIDLQLYVKNPRVACEDGDLSEYLPDQLIGLTGSPASEGNRTDVKFYESEVTPGDIDIGAYIEYVEEEITYVTSVSCTDGVLSYETETKTVLVPNT